MGTRRQVVGSSADCTCSKNEYWYNNGEHQNGQQNAAAVRSQRKRCGQTTHQAQYGRAQQQADQTNGQGTVGQKEQFGGQSRKRNDRHAGDQPVAEQPYSNQRNQKSAAHTLLLQPAVVHVVWEQLL